MTILALVLVAAGFTRYTNGLLKAREAALRVNLQAMAEAIAQYSADEGRYPPSLEALVDRQYLRAIPEDPFTGSVRTWRVHLSGAESGHPSRGVDKVRSSNDGTASDGSRYSEW